MMKTELGVKKSDEEMPKGWKHISSWEVEKLLRTEFGTFEGFEKSCYYKIINPNKTICWLWLHWLSRDSGIDGYGWEFCGGGWGCGGVGKKEKGGGHGLKCNFVI